MTDDEITELLFVRQEPVPAELAMVFAADNEDDMARRTRRGVELYQAGYAPRMDTDGRAGSAGQGLRVQSVRHHPHRLAHP